MLKHFGRQIWRQTRDISVLNYPKHIVYEIYTHQGYFYVSHNKDTDKFEILHSKGEEREKEKNKDGTLFLPNLQ